MPDSAATESKLQQRLPHHQYSVRTLLLIMTVACVLLAIVRAMVPEDVPAWINDSNVPGVGTHNRVRCMESSAVQTKTLEAPREHDNSSS